MPLLIVKLSVKVEDESTLAKFESEVANAVSAVLGKPSEWMMVETYTSVRIYFAGSNAPAASCVVQSIGGLTNENNIKLTAAITKAINEHFSIDPKRAYVIFDEKKGAEWGWNDIILNVV
jgi:phenylpyruvate tautomerase PptA (4-oxalocrotonate tautomerase family)